MDAPTKIVYNSGSVANFTAAFLCEMRKIERIVITGATSSLGTALINECIDRDIEVLALANRGSKNLLHIPHGDHVRVVECTLDELVDIDKLLYGEGFSTESYSYDAFVHFAWTSTGGDIARDKIKEQAKNIK